mmetsp:Transcript_37633/g.59388  ORF Transcript_37633/g.59388 Transcript_37633/m.59388 type:complete len:210 (-) Transcript_37633:708-1337(-)|eukprot:CAMPEP_0201523958 /NCGR_PEP_ID=MMETSP0161_2-20130828/21022_1 /ASSEMBLY_ACC=CAM_ASM_000251 /TAXON_ID=180227 /ORGANISM="Neoparamoeba aestuarina, Strain SoJaBio B1-5/56/2" /LENGTH=209 /DNA_ID=CAMNT_0047923199 /DNA_START=149 /DNA_END=778 /DNA_ORIENTATION=+
MSKLFGMARRAPPVTETVDSMKVTMSNLEKREIYLQQKCDYETQVARSYARTNKRAAMAALKKRKTYQQQLDRLSNARMTLETQIIHIENAAITQEALRAMEDGANAMARQQNNMSVHDVDRIMDKIRDEMDKQEEFNDAMAQPLGVELYDDDELEAELAALEDEVMGVKQQEEERTITAPVVVHSLPVGPVITEEDREIARLEAGMVI